MKSTLSPLTAYFDESGIHGDASHCIVAGFVGSDQEWNKFETRWQKASDGVVFHGNKFFGRKPGGERTKTYKGWSHQKAKDYLTGLVDAITSSRLTPVGAVVEVKAFMAFPENERRYLTGAVYIHNRQRFISTGVLGKPYFLALMHCVTAEQNHSFFLADILEYRPQVGDTGGTDDYRWDVEGWYRRDYNRVWFKSEGQRNTAFKAD